MECPKCNARSGVCAGYADAGRYIRRRACPNCGYKFITVEYATGEPVQGDGRHGGKRTPNRRELVKEGDHATD